MKNLGSIYPLRVYLFFLLFLLVGPSIIFISYKLHGQTVGAIMLSPFYVYIAVFEIADRKRFMMSFLCFSGISDYLLARKILSVFGDELRAIFHERPKSIIKILKKHICTGRKDFRDGDGTKGAMIQLLADHLLKYLAEKVCEPSCNLELSQESISGMKRSPGTYNIERIEDIFKKEDESKREIGLLKKDFDYHLCLVEASGLRVWPRLEGNIAQELPGL